MSAELPLTSVTDVTRRLATAVGTSVSPFTGTAQVQDWGGEWWEYEIEFAVLKHAADGRRLSAFFAALGGQRGTFIFRDPFIRNPVNLGTPQVDGAGQTGSSLITDGWSKGMAAGDFIQLGSGATTRLYQLTADFTPSGGAATLQVTPQLRAATVDNEAITVVSPGVLLRLTAPQPVRIGLADIYRFSVTAREAL
jgi:hypothetical protein